MPTEGLVPALAIYLAAAFFELAGSYALWSVIRLGRSPLWLLAGVVALVLFAGLLTQIGFDASGRAYAAYGGVYILASLVWLWKVDSQSPDISDLIGVGLCIAGTLVILLGRHGSP